MEYLGVDATADILAVKHGYAARLKRIDQAVDIEGFMRLREAYRLATAWCRARQANTQTIDKVPGEEPQRTPDENADVYSRDAPSPVAHESTLSSQRETASSTATSDHAVSPGEPAAHRPSVAGHPGAAFPAEETPFDKASKALQSLVDALNAGATAAVALQAQLRELRQGHLQAPAIFEALFLQRLTNGSLPKRLSLFLLAKSEFDWQDMTHLAQLGRHAQWLIAVMAEHRAWQRESFRLGAGTPIDSIAGANLLDQPGLQPSDFSAKAALHWPQMFELLERFPRYLALRYDQAALDAWRSAFDSATDHAFAKADVPAYATSANTGSKKRSSAWIPVAFGACALALIMGLFLLGTLSKPKDAAAPAPFVTTQTEAHRLRAAVPELPADAPADERTCSYIEQAVHAASWNPPADADLQQRLRITTRLCLNLGLWPNRQPNDPQLQKLGVTVP